MSKLNCTCGNQLSSVMWPNDHIGTLVTQWQIDALEERREMSVREIAKGRAIWECSECGRLAIDHPKAGDRTVKWYSPDAGKVGDLMKRVEADEKPLPTITRAEVEAAALEPLPVGLPWILIDKK